MFNHCSENLDPERQYQKYNKVKNQIIYKKYGITIEQATEMLVKQNYTCPICLGRLDDEIGRNAQIEHCHKTKRVRGIVCLRCNLALGYAQDDPSKLARMIEYLAT